MKNWTPADVSRSLCWIRERQQHVNSCAAELNDPEAFVAAQELQQSIDEDWDSLGSLVANRQRPHSELHARLQTQPRALRKEALSSSN